MFEYIRRLQRKSEEHRQRFALLVALLVTGAIFAVWIFYFLTTTLSPDTASTPGSKTEIEIDGPSPIAALKDAFSEAGKRFSNVFDRIEYESSGDY